MKAKLLPVYFMDLNAREEQELQTQLSVVQTMYQKEAELLPAQRIDQVDSAGADAVLFPQLIGEAYRSGRYLAALKLPVLVITSAFGTVEMWDWEIVSYLRSSIGLQVFTPYTVDLTKAILRALALKRDMNGGTRFLIFQDTPGEGMQANIFKRFFWWEAECTQRMRDAFQVEIVYESYRELNEAAARISDEEARALWAQRKVPVREIQEPQILPAVKLYIAVRNRSEALGNVRGVGANCLNESFHSCTTPCLAWDWLFTYDGLLWACEGDTLSLLSQHLLYSTLQKPLMMTNLYPFLMGMAALKHEKITQFPKADDPEHCALAAHCGYFGLAPGKMCASWALTHSVLEIVNENAVMADCRFPVGPVTIAKLHADMKKLTLIQAELVEYAQFPHSDCRNGGVIRFVNQTGHEVMENLSSHHAIIIEGDEIPAIKQMARVLGLSLELL